MASGSDRAGWSRSPLLGHTATSSVTCGKRLQGTTQDLGPKSYQLLPHAQETGQPLERRYGHNDDIKMFSIITFRLNTFQKIPAEFAFLRIYQNHYKIHRTAKKF